MSEPDHPILQTSLPFTRVIPFLCHGDEGRTKKKKGLMLWSMHGIVGTGTQLFKEKPVDYQIASMGLNLDNSLTSRFLHAAIPNKLYKDNEALWHDLANCVGHSYYRLQTEGFQHNGKTWYACCVGLTGDSPFLSKAACLERSFARVIKKPRDENCTRKRKEPAGICFLCLAGQPQFPFEDLGKNPKWLKSLHIAPKPWKTHPRFLQALGESRPHFLKYDIWHNFHGGLGKTFVASCVAELVPRIFDGNNIDEKLSVLQTHYDTWKRQGLKLKLHYHKIDRDTFGLTSLQVWPVAAWNKFNDTRVFMSWLQDLLETDLFAQNDITQNMLLATAAANRCFSRLFRAGLWLGREEARAAGSDGLLFLHQYAVLAQQALLAQRPRFSMIPKSHFMHHPFLDLYLRSEQQEWTLSPLAHSVQIDEDLVGKVSRLSRRVGSVKQMERTIDRYRAAARLAVENL